MTKAEEVLEALSDFAPGDPVLAVDFTQTLAARRANDGRSDRLMVPAIIQRAYEDHTFEVRTANGWHWIRNRLSLEKAPRDEQS